MSKAPLLDVTDIRAAYDGNDVLFDVCAYVLRSEIVTIVGAPGSGKSTFLKALAGHIPLTGGRILFDGKEISGWSAQQRALAGMSYAPQSGGLFEPQSVWDNLQLGGWNLSRRDIEQRSAELMETLPALRSLLDRKAGLWNGGERQTLSLACALITRPRLLVLDEPSAGLSPVAAERLFETIAGLRSATRGILIVERKAYAALSISDRGYILSHGRNDFEGAAASVLARRRIGAPHRASSPLAKSHDERLRDQDRETLF